MSANTSIDLSLPALPDVTDPILYQELFQLYNAIRSVAVGLDLYTDSGDLNLKSQITVAQIFGYISRLNERIASLEEQLLLANQPVPWQQPGDIGTTAPAIVAATDLSATGNTTVAAFGANGKAASGTVALPAAATDAATTQALANAMRTLLINFGLGS